MYVHWGWAFERFNDPPAHHRRVCVTHSPVSRSSKSIQALGPLGLNMMEFCKAFNAETTAVVPNTPMQVQWMGRVDGLG